MKEVHIEDFDYIVPMDDNVHGDLKRGFSSLGEKLMPSWNIEDPYGGDLGTYEETAAKIEKHVEELSTVLNNRRK